MPLCAKSKGDKACFMAGSSRTMMASHRRSRGGEGRGQGGPTFWVAYLPYSTRLASLKSASMRSTAVGTTRAIQWLVFLASDISHAVFATDKITGGEV